MSAAIALAFNGVIIVAHDPSRPPDQAWLTIEQMTNCGDAVWSVLSTWSTATDAESAGGLHESPLVAFMMRDPDFGWMRRGAGWTNAIAIAGRFTLAEALLLAKGNAQRELRVLRANGQVTRAAWSEFPLAELV